jgi:uncharacterized delta-60 repeat protein
VGGNDRAADNNGPVIDYAGTVGPEGGLVEAHNGRVSLDFAAGAVSGDTNIRVSPLANVGVPGMVNPTVYDLGPDGAVFDAPVMLTLGYNQSEVPDGFDETQFIMLGTAHDTGELVSVPGSTVDPEANTISATISGFSVFGMAIPGCTIEGGPLPWCPPRCEIPPPTFPDDPGGELDPSFGTDGTFTFELGTAGNTDVGELIIDDEDRLLIAAELVRMSVIRVLPDGQGLDPSFGDEGISRYTDTVNSLVQAMALRTDGRIVLYGLRQPAGGGLHLLLARFLRDGELDPSFGEDGVVLDLRLDRLSGSGDVATLPDGRVVVFDAFGLYRFLQDGSADPSFGTEGLVVPESFGSVANVLRRAPDDWIGTWFGNTQLINADGSAGAIYRSQLSGVFVGGLDEIGGGLYVLGGSRQSGSGQDATSDVYAARLRPGDETGSLELDPCFGGAGSRAYDFGSSEGGAASAVQADGRVVIVGGASTDRGDTDLVVVRIRPDGEIDRGFGTDGIVYLDFGGDDVGTGVAIDDEGRIVVVGSSLVGDRLFGDRTAVMARLLP